jgi:hypothetical protein
MQPELLQPINGRKYSTLNSHAAERTGDFREELERIAKVADMLCTGHATLRDRYQRWSLLLDLGVLTLSTWLVALAFVDSSIARKLTPFHLEPMFWIGLLGVFTFILSVVQIKVDWKGKADAFNRSFEIYAEVKRQCSYVLCSSTLISKLDCEPILARYDLATQVGAHMPERQFLQTKRQHKLKVEISKHLDKHPGALIWLLKLKLIWRDNSAERHED